MSSRGFTTSSLFLLALAIVCPAQVLVAPEAQVSLLSVQTGALTVPPTTASTTLDMVVDEDPGGGGSIDVLVTDPEVIVSLIQPNDVEVTVVNAESLGYTFEVYTVSEDDSSPIASPLLMPGTHSVIGLPSGAARSEERRVGKECAD